MSNPDDTLIGVRQITLDDAHRHDLEETQFAILEARRHLRAALAPDGLPSSIVLAIAAAYEELDEAKAAARQALKAVS